ncbi:hypothetical protein V8F20_002402 [Naviculisporaceae sp. PSN 640]
MAQPSTSSSPSRPHPEASPSLVQEPQQQEQQQEQQHHQHQRPLKQPQQPLPGAPTPPPHLPSHAAQLEPSDTSTIQKDHRHFLGLGSGHVAASSSGKDGNTAPTGTYGGSTAHTPVRDQPTSTTTCSPGAPVNGRIDNGQDGTRYNGDGPLPTSPLMSNPQPPPGPPRQPVSYPISASYPTSGMPSGAQYAYPPQAVPPPDPYRSNPTALPSMRTLDHVQPHPQLSQHHPHHPHHQHQHQHTIPLASHMGASMGPGHAMGYYNVAAHPYSMHADPTGGMRFAIAPGLPPDPRIALSGGRHKKEIKRRTKTGCLTCRKRRIKCDETHPTCNNCKKSKRECLGYDPIFKQQQGPAAIQPAPNSNQQQSQQPPPQPPSVPQTLASTPTPTIPSSVTQHPAYQPPVVPSSYPASLPSNVAFESPAASTPQSAKTDTGFDYSTAIDPALQGAETTSSRGTPSPRYPTVKTEVQEKGVGGQGQQLRAKKMKVDDLIALGGPAPSCPSSTPSATVVDEITKLYYEIYVPGLSQFFETQWYNLKDEPGQPPSSNSRQLLCENKAIIDMFFSFLQNIVDIKSTDPADMVNSGHLETHVVWALARLPFSTVAADTSSRSVAPAEDDLEEARSRLHVFEALLSGEVLDKNPLWSPSQGSAGSGSGMTVARENEFGFWYQLGQFLLKSHSSQSVEDTSARERCLSHMRSLLDGRENRDVLYSFAVLREYTLRWDATTNEQSISSQVDESDPRSKLAVATRFIRNEASTEATTNVVRQFSNLAYRAFVRPGANSKLRC